MFKHLFRFEWLFWKRKRSFYAMLAFFFALGFLCAAAAVFPFPDTNRNSPYVISYLTGLLSLLCIFSTSLMAAQCLFREQDAHFDAILFATPLRKGPYVLSRLCFIFGANLFCFFLLFAGLALGHVLHGSNAPDYGPFRGWHYLQPFCVLLVPNALLCTALSCCTGLITRSKMLVYLAAVFIYFLYWGIAIATKSPLVANSAPQSAEALSRAARLDPFGVSAFMEQTQQWTAQQRNASVLHLHGNLLINRLLWLTVSVLLLWLAYARFRFNFSSSRKVDVKRKTTNVAVTVPTYKAMHTHTTGLRYTIRCLYRLVRTECRLVFKSIPLWLLGLGWLGFLGIELYSTISGNRRMPELFATSGLMVSQILAMLPMVLMLALLFYSSEIFHRSRGTRFDAMQDPTALPPAMHLLGQWLSLVMVIVFFCVLSMLCGMGMQVFFGASTIDLQLYAAVLYFTGLPLSLTALLLICIQVLIPNRYTALTFAGVVLALCHTSIGAGLGLRHPLVRFANTFQENYSGMAGFGNGPEAFGTTVLYWLGISGLLILIAMVSWNFRKGFRVRMSKRLLFLFTGLVLCFLLLGTWNGCVLYARVELASKTELNDRSQAYELRYGRLKAKAQPGISSVRTRIDLFPESRSFGISGEYVLVNKTLLPIDTLFISGHTAMRWKHWKLHNGKLCRSDPIHGQYAFCFSKPLLPNDSARLQFSFQYEASPYTPAEGFNTIVDNGSFSRISRYFPTPGYQPDKEISDPQERQKRQLPALHNVLALDAPRTEANDFILLDATISTSRDQTAIGTGELMQHWTQGERAYYRYVTPSPIPFRFAFASGRYAFKTIRHGQTRISVYYDPGHGANIGHLLRIAQQTLEYGEAHFGKYPSPEIRLVEISSFSRGFAGTAYPGALFINESFGFQNRIGNQPEKDILNEMVSHELSHAWWGNAGLAPDYREGSRLLTETLAMYTELMLYKQFYGDSSLKERVQVHKDLYLSQRVFDTEEPLYRAHPEKTYLAYDKGMVVMYQLYKHLGEASMNQALRALYRQHAYPHAAPVSTDLLEALYAAGDTLQRAKIDELLKQIVTYDLSLQKASVKPVAANRYTMYLEGTANKYLEDGKGHNARASVQEPLFIRVEFENGRSKLFQVMTTGDRIHAQFELGQRPVRVVLDPEGLLLDRNDTDNEKNVSVE